ncbi:MAG: hypothetical protein SOX32_12885 [Candidatus Choladocola sp.]|nr:hypothetical protein [Candidatus Choladocola sp.]
MSSIELETEKYCYGCECFEAEQNTVIDYYDQHKEVNVKVYCRNLEKCRRIAKHIAPPGEKNEKTLGNM